MIQPDSLSPIIDNSNTFTHVKHSLDSALLLVDAFIHSWRIAAAQLEEVIQHAAQAVQVLIFIS